jgi:hypothetical protein
MDDNFERKRGYVMTLNEATQIMTNEIASILADSKPTMYLYGSVVLDDFRLGWSDIDILVLTEREITEPQADTLVGLRQALLERFPGNPYFRLFEGGMLSVGAFLDGKNERTIYWGTRGQRITDGYHMDSFSITLLKDSGVLLYGKDIRHEIVYPPYSRMRDDVIRHLDTARKYGNSVGWLLDIARGIYTVHTGKIIAKTAAADWVLKQNLCPDADALHRAINVRREPTKYTKDDKAVDNTVIQRFANVLEAEIKVAKTPPMTFEDFLKFRDVIVRNSGHERIIKMFYPYLESVSGISGLLSKTISEIIGVDFYDNMKTGCFNGNIDGGIPPYGIPDLYCKWDNGIMVYVYSVFPECELITLQDNEYVLFVLSDGITDDIERTADRYIFMREAAK